VIGVTANDLLTVTPIMNKIRIATMLRNVKMRFSKRTYLLLMVFAVLLVGCSAKYEPAYQFSYTFDEGQDGWVAGFADLPADYDPDLFELDSGWSELPPGLEGGAFYLSGNNRSDDLYMYLQQHITGLKPETPYQVKFSVDLASNTPEGMMGIGGSPGENVYIKAGAVNREPELITDEINWLRLNFDKGNQASEGKDTINLGTIANPNINLDTFTGKEYALMNLNNQEMPFTVTSNKDGNIWVLIGSDSGFEGATTLYYDAITIDLVEEQ